MCDLETSFHFIKPIFQNQKYIIYKGNKYPIDFDLIKKNSQFFFINRKKYKKVEEIEITEEPIDIPEQAIQAFISCCQNSPCKIDPSIVFPLHILSIRYGVPELTKLTTDFLSRNEKKTVIKSILFKIQLKDTPKPDLFESQINIDTKSEEDAISSNLIDYIINNESDLLSIPVPILYNIISNFYSKLENPVDSSKESVITDFLFKCLDKYKRSASVLFVNVDFGNQRKDILYKLLQNYQDTFDFNMLDPKSLLKTTTEMMSEFYKLQIENSKLRDEIGHLAKVQREEKKEFDEFKSMVNKEFKRIINEFTEKQNKMQTKIDQISIEKNEIQKNLMFKIDQISIEQNNMKNQINQKVSNERLNSFQEKKEFNDFKLSVNDKLRRLCADANPNQHNLIYKIEQITKEQNKLKETINQKVSKGIIIPFEQNKEFQGIINYLQKNSKGNSNSEVDATSSSIADNSERYSPKNAIKYDDEKKDFRSENQPNSWISIDFKNNRIVPKSYTIRSFEGPKDKSAHLKTWFIEGSNDNVTWKVIDEQKDCTLLNAPSIAHTFAIENPYLEEFRFLRLRQPDKNVRGDHFLCVGSIEFYGKLL